MGETADRLALDFLQSRGLWQGLQVVYGLIVDIDEAHQHPERSDRETEENDHA